MEDQKTSSEDVGNEDKAGNDNVGVSKRRNANGNDIEAQESAPPSVVEKDVPDAEMGQEIVEVGYSDIAKQFSLLGWTAFGGPSAHIALFEKRLVEKLHWMSTDIYAELFALGQCMPGPTSTQVSFAIGTIKKGVTGGLLSGILFQYPGAIIMCCIGVFAAKQLEHPRGALNGMVSGVSAIGVALVASAAKSMASKLCKGPLLATICTLATIVAYYWPKAYTFPCLIIAGGLITLFWAVYRKEPLPDVKIRDQSVRSHGFTMPAGGVLLLSWIIVLVVSIVLVNVLSHAPDPLRWWEVFYRIGSIIFGGGQVVLPMLYEGVVQRTCDSNNVCVDKPDTWVTSKQFYAGLGIVQALPGPLFNFSSYLGAIMALNGGYVFIVGAILAWFGLFLPGIMLIFGIMPFWGHFRKWKVYRRALPGFNAAGVGLIITSVFSLTFGVLEQTDFLKASLCLGILGFTAVDQLKWFEPFVVVAGGVLGICAWAVGMD
ncbi:hypothetical protein R1sor_023628 [Riccia sorocarpa]|uniref:Chromate transporter n=1 Tax=Riccia sorocarpa TaxID=122646 RepID=A0ABD3GN75_9MARC